MSLGSAIAQARESAGLSIEDLAARTSIRTALLREFELDHFQKSGGETYARGHVRNIANAVGVDPSVFLNIYETEQITAKRAMHELLVENSVMAPPNQKSRISLRALSTVSAIAVVLAVGSQIVYTNLKPAKSASNLAASVITPSATPSVDSSPASTPVATETQLATSGANQPPESASQVVAPATSGVNIQVTATRGSSWLSVTSKAGVPIFSGNLAQGASNTFSDPDGVNIRFGNAGALDLVVNGVPVAAPGAMGEVVDVSYGSN
ncbi:MAG: DUF4115 domain-containing protein [Actinobacteria bacterium]|nr:DUF4115 domain-containing protein [Actinomycetota bacterium]